MRPYNKITLPILYKIILVFIERMGYLVVDSLLLCSYILLFLCIGYKIDNMGYDVLLLCVFIENV
jgi:hypothetical protein